MKSTRNVKHTDLINYAQGLRLALYKGLHASRQHLHRMALLGSCRSDTLPRALDSGRQQPAGRNAITARKPNNCPLRVELAKVLDIPGIAHRQAIFGLQADSARPGDSYYPIRAFPLRRQLVGILGRLNAPKNKVAFLKTPSMNFAAMIAAQSLLIASGSHSGLETVLLKEQRIVLTQLFLLELIISEHSR